MPFSNYLSLTRAKEVLALIQRDVDMGNGKGVRRWLRGTLQAGAEIGEDEDAVPVG